MSDVVVLQVGVEVNAPDPIAIATGGPRVTLFGDGRVEFFDRNVEVGVPTIVELCEQHDVPMVLAGHWHGDALYDGEGVDRRDTWDFPGTKFVVTTTAGTDLRPEWSTAPARFGYRVVEVEGDQVRSYTYDVEGDGTRHFSASHPLGELEIERVAPGVVVRTADVAGGDGWEHDPAKLGAVLEAVFAELTDDAFAEPANGRS